MRKSVLNVSLEELDQIMQEKVVQGKRAIFSQAWAHVLADCYGIQMRCMYTESAKAQIPQKHLIIIQKYGKIQDAMANYIRSCKGDFTSDGNIRTSENEEEPIVMEQNVIILENENLDITNLPDAGTTNVS